MTSALSPGPRFWLLWDLVIVTVIATIAVEYRSESVVDVMIGLGMAAALVARRRMPGRVMIAVSALALLQLFLSPSVPAGYDLAVLIAMAAVVTHTRRPPHAYLAGAVVAAGVTALAARAVDPDRQLSWLDQVDIQAYLFLIVVCAAVWLLAYTLRSSRERAEHLAERAAVAERERDHLTRLAVADERAAIARELHDVVAHSLAVMIAQADGASYVLDKDPTRAGDAIRTVAETGRNALDDMHRIVAVLRDGKDDGKDDAGDRRTAGLDGLETLLDQARAAGVRAELRLDGETGGLSATDELTLFRLVQEGLTNTLRHAGPGATVTITVQVRPGEAVLEMIDDGAGKPAGTAPVPRRGAGGNGLIGMRERVAVHGGEFEAGPGAETGWRLRAVIPIKEAT